MEDVLKDNAEICDMAEKLIEENESLEEENNAYKDWVKLHYALYFLFFVYGLVYGAYFKTHQQEL